MSVNHILRPTDVNFNVNLPSEFVCVHPSHFAWILFRLCCSEIRCANAEVRDFMKRFPIHTVFMGNGCLGTD